MYRIEDFSLDLTKNTSPIEHIWVNSGHNAVARLHSTIMGVKGLYSPPVSAGDLELNVSVESNGHEIKDTGRLGKMKGDCGFLLSKDIWYPDHIYREGTYHYILDEKLLSFKITSKLIPLSNEIGFMLALTLTNRADGVANIKIMPNLKVGSPYVLPLDSWDFGFPQKGTSQAIKISENLWQTDDVQVRLISDDLIAQLQKNESKKFLIAVVINEKGRDSKIACKDHLIEFENRTMQKWESRIDKMFACVPKLNTDIKGLDNYYKRSLISGLVNIWDKEEFPLSPFPTVAGVSGMGICVYTWDIAFCAQAFVLMHREHIFKVIDFFLNNNIMEHSRLSINGKGIGFSYSYNTWSIFAMAWYGILYLGKGFEYYEKLVDLMKSEEKRYNHHHCLLDYGTKRNLLETRSAGYEHFVPSPNAERVWCYERLADIADRMGLDDGNRWREKAKEIKESIIQNLWNEKEQWFDCLYPNGHRETIYSVQIFNLIKMGICDNKMVESLFNRINEEEFLCDYGINSISKLDELHFELNDPDWSGGGSYVGQGPALAQILWENSKSNIAFDVLRRFFWMGEMLPYYPQESFGNKPIPVNKAPNELAGLCGAQSIIYGMIGITHSLDKYMSINPNPPKEGYIELKGYKFREDNYDIYVDGNELKIICNQEILYQGKPQKVEIKRR